MSQDKVLTYDVAALQLQEIVTRLSINAGRAAEMKRSICGLFEKIIQIDETDGLSLEQECKSRPPRASVSQT